MTAALVGIGAGLFLLLGLAHAIFTLQSTPDGGPMMPTDAATRDAMQRPGGLGMAPEIDSTLYRAWIGFNYSHSLGVVIAASIVLYHAAHDLGAAADRAWFVALALVAPVLYLTLAQLYWFDKPRDAIAFGGVLVWVGMLIELA